MPGYYSTDDGISFTGYGNIQRTDFSQDVDKVMIYNNRLYAAAYTGLCTEN